MLCFLLAFMFNRGCNILSINKKKEQKKKRMMKCSHSVPLVRVPKPKGMSNKKSNLPLSLKNIRHDLATRMLSVKNATSKVYLLIYAENQA